jgi:hypothetical protein
MAYTVKDFPTKAALKRALAAGESIRVFQPGGLFPCPTDGQVSLEGPHYPKPHSWYATATLRNGLVVKVS